MAERHALLIGNSTFSDPRLRQLSAPENDVIELRTVLQRPDIADFQTKLCLNAGIVEVRKAISELFRDRVADDTLLLYYTGHGLRHQQSGHLYLALPETRASAPDEISIEASFIQTQMQNSHALRQIVILDCCHSGAFKDGTKVPKGAPKLARTDFAQSGHGIYILAASTAEQSAYEFEGRSIFTRHIVHALQTGEAAPDRDNITLNDLHAYVSRGVTAEYPSMLPMLWTGNQTQPLIIARNPDPRKPVPPELVEKLAHGDPITALGAADRLLDMVARDPRRAQDARRVLIDRLDSLETLSAIVADKIRAGLNLPDPTQYRDISELSEQLEAERARHGQAETEWEAERDRLAASLGQMRDDLATALAAVQTAPPDQSDKIADLGQQLAEATDRHDAAVLAWALERKRLAAAVESAQRDLAKAGDVAAAQDSDRLAQITALDQALQQERDRATHAKVLMVAERETLTAERAALTAKLDAVQRDLKAANEAAEAEARTQSELIAELNAALQAERDRTAQAQESAVVARTAFDTQLEAERARQSTAAQAWAAERQLFEAQLAEAKVPGGQVTPPTEIAVALRDAQSRTQAAVQWLRASVGVLVVGLATAAILAGTGKIIFVGDDPQPFVVTQTDPAQPGPAPVTPAELREAQGLLAQLGHYTGPQDGIVGNQTETAIRQFQRQAGLTETGALDPATLAKLRDVAKALRKACDACPEMVLIPWDRFQMGSPATERGRLENEGPQPTITIATFALARTEVTFDQWEACERGGGCKTTPTPDDSGFGRGDRPVINISWHDAKEYIDWLNSQSGENSYRLPTEAEWEYAARAGTTSPYPWGKDASHYYANYGKDECCEGLKSGRDAWINTAPVGRFPRNDLGLLDMHGNVWEWVADCYLDKLNNLPWDGAAVLSGNGGDCARRVVRGGSWGDTPQFLRSAYRGRFAPGYRNYDVGFRPARTLTP